MKYILINEPPESVLSGVGFSQWKNAMGAIPLSGEAIQRLEGIVSFDIVHFLWDDRKLMETIRLAKYIKAVSHDSFLIISIETRLSGNCEEICQVLFRYFDLVLCSNDDIYRICIRNAPSGCMVKAEAPPVDLAYYKSKAIVREDKNNFTIIADGYSVWRFISDMGFAFVKDIFLSYNIRFVSSRSSDKDLIEAVSSSKYVFAPKPLYDGGRIATLCALCRTMLIAHPSLEGAKGLFPYTIFDPENMKELKYMFMWLFSADGLVPSFLDNAYHSLSNFNFKNKNVQLRNLIRYHRPVPEKLISVLKDTEEIYSLCIAEEIRLVKGPEHVWYGINEFVVVCLLKDGEEHLASFLSHYRNLGCRHFIFIDNGSSDRTLEILYQQEDVTLYVSHLPHKYYEIEIRRIIAEKHCRNRWCLWVDIDELFDYPYSDELDMHGLLAYLHRNKYNAMAAHMLDMYSDGSPEAEEGQYTSDLKVMYPCYDLSEIKKKPYFHQTNIAYNRNNTLGNPDICCFWGGIRKQVFSGIDHDNILTKHPLIFLDGCIDPITNAHFSDKAKVADITGVLFHYKFVSSFREKVKKAYAARNYVKFAQNEYDAYYNYYLRTGSFTIRTPETRRLRHVNELLGAGFILSTLDYKRFIKKSILKPEQALSNL